jgi:hypothetical protein
MTVTTIVAAQNNWLTAYPNAIISVGVGKESYLSSTVRYSYKYDSYETGTNKLKYKFKYNSQYSPNTIVYKYRYLANIVPVNTKLTYRFNYRSDRLVPVKSEYLLTYDVNLPEESTHKLFYKCNFKTEGTSKFKVSTKFKYLVEPVSKNTLSYKFAYSTNKPFNARILPFITTDDNGLTYNLNLEIYSTNSVDWRLYVTNPTRYTLVDTDSDNIPNYVGTINREVEQMYNTYSVPEGLNYQATRELSNIALDQPIGITLIVDGDIAQYMTFNVGSISHLSGDVVVNDGVVIYSLQALERTVYESITRLDLQFINDNQCCFSTKYIGVVCSPY